VMLRLVFSAALSGSKEAPFREMWWERKELTHCMTC
jgi:hypothetical protein